MFRTDDVQSPVITMKFASRMLVLAVCGVACAAHAGPVGRSAKMAARLKKHPTSSWLAHYLPDDRYKIAGGIWKYVSTDLDTYYHRPDSPNMLRQPAGTVIGFSSAAEAEEAGYRADASVYTSGPLGMSMPEGAALAGGQRIVFSDKASSIVLPAGWKRGPSGVQSSQYGAATTDTIYDPKGQRYIFTTFTASPSMNLDFGKIVTVEYMNALKKNLGTMVKQVDSLVASSGSVNSKFNMSNITEQLNRANSEQHMFSVNINGFKGIGMTASVKRAGQPSRGYSFGRGRKVWSLTDYSTGRNSLAPVLKTLQMR